MRSLRYLLAATVAVLSTAALAEVTVPAEAASPRGYDWLATAFGGRTQFEPGADRSDAVLSLRRYFSAGSLGLEALRARYEGGREGDAVAADAYLNLWPGAYANLRWQQETDGTAFADHSSRVELYQALPGGWEPAASWDRLSFPTGNTDIYGAALGRYVGNFYLRARAARVSDGSSNIYRGSARWYYLGDGDTFLEGSLGSGRSVEDRAQGIPGSDTRSAGLAWQWYFHPRWGVKANADWTRMTGGGSGTERGAGLTLLARW